MKVSYLIFVCWLATIFSGCALQSSRVTVYEKDFPFPAYEHDGGDRSYRFAPVDRGLIVTLKNDTLVGLVKLLYYPYEHHIPILPSGKKGDSAVANIKRKDIRFIRTYSDTTQKQFTDYVNVGFDGLWRCLGMKNNVGLFDNYDNMGNGQKYAEKRMLLVTPKQKLLLYDSFQILFHSRYSYLLKFINKRYSKHFKKQDFENERAEINYILDKENEQ